MSRLEWFYPVDPPCDLTPEEMQDLIENAMANMDPAWFTGESLAMVAIRDHVLGAYTAVKLIVDTKAVPNAP